MMKTLLAVVGCILAVTPGDFLTCSGGGMKIDLDRVLKLKRQDWGFGFKVPTYKNESAVLLQRIDGGTLDFDRCWDDYTNGFQDEKGEELWLGNEKVYIMTSETGVNYTLRVEVQLDSNGSWYYAEYSSFYLESRDSYYKIHVSGYSGDAGDSLSVIQHDGMPFSTGDADHDLSEFSCAQTYNAGWWFNNCIMSCLTCPRNQDFVWSYANALPLKAARMMIRKNK